MKKTRIIPLVVALILLMALAACSDNPSPVDIPTPAEQIYLYGEEHGVKKILDKEFELWQDYYQNKNMRHLFVELSYYTAEFLNIWMQSDSDDILEALYSDWDGIALHKPQNRRCTAL